MGPLRHEHLKHLEESVHDIAGLDQVDLMYAFDEHRQGLHETFGGVDLNICSTDTPTVEEYVELVEVSRHACRHEIQDVCAELFNLSCIGGGRREMSNFAEEISTAFLVFLYQSECSHGWNGREAVTSLNFHYFMLGEPCFCQF